MWPYADDQGALTDALRLSRGMTYKATICDLPYGGGKSVMIGNSRTEKTEELLLAMGRLVESFAGAYVIASSLGAWTLTAATAGMGPCPWGPSLSSQRSHSRKNALSMPASGDKPPQVSPSMVA